MIVPSVIHEVHEIMSDTFHQRVMIVSETQMHVPPWLHADEGWQESRLKWAVEAVAAGQVHETDLAYEVQGDTALYPIPKGAMHRCPCPAAHYGPSQHCKHRVALELYMRVRQAYPEEQPLPFPPTSVDERLAAPAKEVLMEGDPYIPEPDAVPVAVLEAPAPTSDLERSVAEWTHQRKVLTRYIRDHLREGTDYYSLKVGGRTTRPTLSKAGSEKFLGLFHLHASFRKDDDTWEMLGRPTGVLCYVCTLLTQQGQIVGEGRGSREVKKDQGDVNKAVKMAQKSAMIDAVLRTGALSEQFTQDVTEEEDEPAKPTSADLRSRIWALVKAADATITTREASEAYVQRVTGMPLVPDNYGGIVAKLEGR